MSSRTGEASCTLDSFVCDPAVEQVVEGAVVPKALPKRKKRVRWWVFVAGAGAMWRQFVTFLESGSSSVVRRQWRSGMGNDDSGPLGW